MELVFKALVFYLRESPLICVMPHHLYYFYGINVDISLVNLILIVALMSFIYCLVGIGALEMCRYIELVLL